MNPISQYMTQDHRACDAHLAAAEEMVSGGDWERAVTQFETFRQAMERHLGLEEETLFPEFEQAMASAVGPTQVMRLEHQQMRDLIRQMAAALHARDADAYLGLSETLLIMMQQHNVKEEQILYPMTDEVLGSTDVLQRMRQV